MKSKKMIVFAVPLLVLLLAFAIVPASADDGANGTLDIGATSTFDGATIAVRCYDLDVSSDYFVNYTGDATGFAFTTGADQDTYVVYLTIDKPSGSEVVTVMLVSGTGAAIIDQQTLQCKDDSIIPLDFIMTIGIAFMLLAIIAGLIVKLRKG